MEEQKHKEEIETREQILEVIQFYLPTLTDRQLRMVKGFVKGLRMNTKKE